MKREEFENQILDAKKRVDDLLAHTPIHREIYIELLYCVAEIGGKALKANTAKTLFEKKKAEEEFIGMITELHTILDKFEEGINKIIFGKETSDEDTGLRERNKDTDRTNELGRGELVVIKKGDSGTDVQLSEAGSDDQEDKDNQ